MRKANHLRIGNPPVIDQKETNQKKDFDIDQQRKNQRERIQKGIANGRLTEEEAKLLNREQAEIKRMVDEANSDGVISKEEQAKIRQALDHASSNIKGEKHDAEGSSSGKGKPVAK